MRLRHFSWDVLPSSECGACKTDLYLLPRHSIPLLGELLICRKQSTDSWVYFSSRWSKWVPGPPPAPSQAAPQNSAVLVCNVFVLLSAVTEPALFIWIKCHCSPPTNCCLWCTCLPSYIINCPLTWAPTALEIYLDCSLPCRLFILQTICLNIRLPPRIWEVLEGRNSIFLLVYPSPRPTLHKS